MDLQLRPATTDELPAWWESLADTFAENVQDIDRDLDLTVIEPERTLLAEDDGTIVATGGIFTRQLTVPGAVVPLAGVTFVSVSPTHRRRGLLTAMMQRQFDELHAGGEAVAGLWASESVIYQRFGYGMAARLAVQSGPTPELGFRPSVDFGTGRVRPLSREDALPLIRPVYEAVRAVRPGHLDRDERWWNRRYADHEHWRNGGTTLRHAVYEETDGTVSGWTTYRVKGDWQPHSPNNQIIVQDLLGTTPQAVAALWRFVLDHDLVRRVQRWSAPVDDPLTHLLANPRSLTVDVMDSLWLRLVDVDRALAARRYRVEVDVVFEVADVLCPWNAGRWRLAGGPEGATCTATDKPADVSLGVTELGAAYLGGVSLLELAAAGRVSGAADALSRASLAFGWDPLPWCPEVF